MKLEDQVCSEEQSQKLFDLGVRGETLFYHTGKKWGVMPHKSIDFKNGYVKNAFTVAELNEMLPLYNYAMKRLADKAGTEDWICENNDGISCCGDTQAKVLAEMLIFYIEEKHLSIEEVNNRLNQN